MQLERISVFSQLIYIPLSIIGMLNCLSVQTDLQDAQFWCMLATAAIRTSKFRHVQTLPRHTQWFAVCVCVCVCACVCVSVCVYTYIYIYMYIAGLLEQDTI